MDYLRQEMAHPFTHVLRVKTSRQRGRGQPLKVNATYKGHDVQEVESAVRRVLVGIAKKYKVSVGEAGGYVAIEIAKRLQGPLASLSHVVARWASA